MRCKICGRHIFYARGRWHHYHRQHHWAVPRYNTTKVITNNTETVITKDNTNWILILIVVVAAIALYLK
jgi:hypothetical protein